MTAITAAASHSDGRCTTTAETWGMTFRCTRPADHAGVMHSMNMSKPERPARENEMTVQQLQAEADALQAQIEADLRSQGLDPAMGDHSHPLNEAWKCIQADIADAAH